jgi:hypothetical protein
VVGPPVEANLSQMIYNQAGERGRAFGPGEDPLVSPRGLFEERGAVVRSRPARCSLPGFVIGQNLGRLRPGMSGPG